MNLDMESLQLTRPTNKLEQDYLALVAVIAAAGELLNYGSLLTTAEKFITTERNFAAFC